MGFFLLVDMRGFAFTRDGYPQPEPELKKILMRIVRSLDKGNPISKFNNQELLDSQRQPCGAIWVNEQQWTDDEIDALIRELE